MSHVKTEDRLRQIFQYANAKRLKLYLFIDEYDNFANTILTTAGQQAYHNLTHGEGFFRFFFNLLKGGTGGQLVGLRRLFITGVSPITLDDVTSGFNIANNISLDGRFNEMIGFTDAEVRAMLTYYHDAGLLHFDVEETFALMSEWYNNYCFSTKATSRLFNSDMVLYFLEHVCERAKLPDTMIDQNVWIAYSKLHPLFTYDNSLNSNVECLKTIVEHGEISSSINPGIFSTNWTEVGNFISLLYYHGLLSLADVRDGAPWLCIPNLVMREVMKGYIPSSLSV